MTPYEADDTPTQRAYNTAHRVTRVLVEQTIGVLKRRWGILAGCVRARNMDRCCRQIVACVILHNFGIDYGNDILSHFFILKYCCIVM